MITRTHIPGDTWLYYKIYSGEKTADRLLIEVIHPLMETLQKEGLVSLWFFIRYNDPLPHIRLRMYVAHPEHLGVLILRLHQALQPWVQNDTIHYLSIDNYQRELERYGVAHMELVEQLFAIDSVHTLRLLAWDADESTRLYYALVNMHQTLHAFQLPEAQLLQLIAQSTTAFKAEFKANKKTNQQLNEKFKMHRQSLMGYLAEPPQPVSPLTEILQRKRAADQPVIAQLLTTPSNVPLSNLLNSLLHMQLNRIFYNRQRQYEMLCYDFLARWYAYKPYQPANDHTNENHSSLSKI
jgi:thiopeptide-type bacteriocin biosynthesis protein